MNNEKESSVIEVAQSFRPRVTDAIVQPNPMAMLAVAVQKGMDVTTIKDLMDLQDRWEKNEARKAFVVALSEFKANPPELSKNKHVSFTTAKGQTDYWHATLDEVSVNVGKALASHGLSHRWDVEQKEGLIRVTCVLTHSMGHSERVPMESRADDSGGKNSIQAIGSTVTYLQRYTLLAATGMAVKDQDDDGEGGDPKGMPDDEFKAFANCITAATSKAKAKEAWQEAAKSAEGYKDLDAAKKLKQVLIDHGAFIDRANKS